MRGRDSDRERERELRWRDNELRRRTDSKCGNDIDEWRHNEDIEGGRRGTETGQGLMLLIILLVPVNGKLSLRI